MRSTRIGGGAGVMSTAGVVGSSARICTAWVSGSGARVMTGAGIASHMASGARVMGAASSESRSDSARQGDADSGCCAQDGSSVQCFTREFGQFLHCNVSMT